MKKLSLLSAIVMIFISCNCQKKAVEQATLTSNGTSIKQETAMPKLEYEANTRGFYQKIVIENNIITIISDRNSAGKGETIAVSNQDLNELMEAFQGVKIEDLATYKDPTQKRFYDGAAIANLKIYKDGKEYQTTDFDHGFPPVEIEKLVNKIVSFGKQ